MPTAPPRACASCGGLVRAGGHVCAGGRPAADRARGTAHARGYTKAWAHYARRWRATHPFCGMRLDGAYSAEHSLCVQQGDLLALAQVVDHIVALRDGGSLWDPANHQSLCTRCNLRKG
jgi:5-methylcytosine-specific restriction enzyme A